jgi:hypothetical protein
MPIQKFKYGQEITSAKLNEIVSFVNNLEAFSNNAQFWNENIDSKIAGFQTQLNNIVNEIKSLLDTAENFDALLTAFVDLKNQYEALVAENVETLLENLFNPQSFFINPNGFVVIGGVVTSTQLTAIAGPQGATGATGAAGSNGSNGKTIITNTGVPNNNTGTNGDVYFDVNNFDFYLKANDVWGLIGNTKGPQGSVGPQGASARILFRYQTEAGLAYLTEPPASALVKFMEFKVIYSNETNQQIELKPWVRLQVRNDRFFPVQVPNADPKKVILSWSATEGEWPENGLNIRGEDGLDGENGLNGTNGTSVSIKGGFDNYEDLEDITSPTLGDGYLIEGDLWVYTGGTANSSTPLPPNLGSIFDGFLNAGTIQGPTGPAPVVQAEVVENLPSTVSASVSVENPSPGTYKLDFKIPRGDPGTRGSLIFNVNTVNDLPPGVSWEGNTLRVNDLFIVNTTGGIYRITETSPWEAPALIYSAAASNHAHGNISNAGVVNTNTAAASGQHLVVTSSADLIQQSAIELGTSTTTFLNNAGAWATPYAHPTQSAIAVNATDNGINVVDSVTVNTLGHVTAVGTRDLSNATTSAAGVMSAADKTKLDGIATSANNYTHPTNGANTTISNANGTVLSSIAVNSLGHVTAVGSKTLAAADLPSHTHAISDVTDLQTTLNSKATPSDITTAINNLISSAPGALDTLDELAAALGDDANFASTITTALAGKVGTSDSRLTDARTPTSHSHTSSDLPANTVIGTTYPGLYAPTTGSILYLSAYGWSTTTTPSVAGLAASSHSHGNIGSTGSWITSPQSITTGDTLVITKSGFLNNSQLAFGNSPDTFLRNDGSWGYLGYGITSRVNVSTSETTYVTAFSTSTLPVGSYIVQFNGAFFKTNSTAANFILRCRFSNSGYARISGFGSHASLENALSTNSFYLNNNTNSDTDATGTGFQTGSLSSARNNVIIQFNGMIRVTTPTSILIRIASTAANSGLGLEAGSGFTIIRVA